MSTSENLPPLGCGQAISCTNCRTRHVINPPASEYMSTLLDPCPRDDYQG